MKRDEIVTGEALPDDTGGNVIDITGMVGLRVHASLDPAAQAALEEIEKRAFRLYQRAWAENEKAPSLHTAAALVRAYNAYADVMGVERV